ncbi:MAG: DUF4111 domain-containing protein [Candidatus Hydrogenedentota bacterium]|nr:MAG: DUF4111 domain-containing protein [Candidatus Hydrogenedentota bacterium]
MSQYGWTNCPGNVRIQVEGFVDALRKILGDNLVGIYLHGSLAFGCFNPERSDLDLLVLTAQGIAVETKRRIAELLLRHSAAPTPIEISFLRRPYIHPWQYPTPFDFHYGEDWRENTEKELSCGAWRTWNERLQKDADLAAHVTVTSRRGIVLYGKPVKEVFPPVPEEHFVASIVSDFEWARERMAQYPISFILNACRVWAYLLEGQLCSKEQAGSWALHTLAEQFRGVVAQALELYRGNREEDPFDESTLQRFAEHMAEQISSSRTDISPL